MDHPCYKCGQSVEDGVPFCAHCGAPQIRVTITEPLPATALSSDEPAHLEHAGPLRQELPGMARAVVWSQALPQCAAAALLATLALLLGLTFPAAAITGGFLAVVFYRRRHIETVITTGLGVRLGAACGLVCFLIFGIFTAVASTATDVRAKFQAQMLDAAQRWAASHSADPQTKAVLDSLKTPEGLAMMMVFAGIAIFLLFIVLAGIGGALGGVFFSRRDRS